MYSLKINSFTKPQPKKNKKPQITTHNHRITRDNITSDFKPTYLLNKHINLIPILHTEFLGGLTFMQSLAVEQEAHIAGSKALSLAVSIHEFLQLGRCFYFEEYLLAVLCML